MEISSGNTSGGAEPSKAKSISHELLTLGLWFRLTVGIW